jgi:hypothetical protein
VPALTAGPTADARPLRDCLRTRSPWGLVRLYSLFRRGRRSGARLSLRRVSGASLCVLCVIEFRLRFLFPSFRHLIEWAPSLSPSPQTTSPLSLTHLHLQPPQLNPQLLSNRPCRPANPPPLPPPAPLSPRSSPPPPPSPPSPSSSPLLFHADLLSQRALLQRPTNPLPYAS